MDNQFGDVEWWAQRIGRRYRLTVAGFIKTGKMLLEARARLGYRRWGQMFEDGMVTKPLDFGLPVAEKLMAIARNPILENSANWQKFSAAVSTLYELSRLPQEVLTAAMHAGKVTAKTTAAQAARLRDPAAKPEPDWWTHWAALKRVEVYARKELRRCLKVPQELKRYEDFDPAAQVGHLLCAVAHELLTPLPKDVEAELRADLAALTNEEADRRNTTDADRRNTTDPHEALHDRDLLIRWIADQGGMKWTKDYDGLPHYIFRKDGLGYDVLFDMLAKKTNLPTRKVERLFIHTLSQHPSISRARRKPRPGVDGRHRKPRPSVDDGRRRRAEIKNIKDLLEGRALKTGLVPPYTVTRWMASEDQRSWGSLVELPYPLAPIEEVRRRLQAIKDRRLEAGSSAPNSSGDPDAESAGQQNTSRMSERREDDF